MTTTVLTPPTSLVDSVSTALMGKSNYYPFTVSSTGIYTFKAVPIFTPGTSKGDADFILYQLIGGSQVLKSASDNITGQTDLINVVLETGNYQLQAQPFIGKVDYTLSVTLIEQLSQDYSDSGLSNSYSLGAMTWNITIATTDLPKDHTLVADTGNIIDFRGNHGDMNDAYSFSIDKPSTVTITLTPDANSNVDLVLYNEQGDEIKGSFNASGEVDTVIADVKAGTYWVDTSFQSTSNTAAGGNFVAHYDLSLDAVEDVLPITRFHGLNTTATSEDNAKALAETFNYNNSGKPENITISNAVYRGMAEQAATVTNFAGDKNAGVFLTTGNASSLFGHTYNEKQGVSTSDAETVKNWSNTDGLSPSMEPPTATGNVAGYNEDIFKAVSSLVTEQNKVLDRSSTCTDYWCLRCRQSVV